MVSLEIKLLGEFSLSYAGQSVENLNANRLQSLLTYLLVYRHAPQPRQQIASHLWPDTTEKQARTNLRNLLFQLKKAFPAHESFIALERKTLQWRADAAYFLDVAEFESLLDMERDSIASAHLSSGDGLVGRYEKAVQLYGGDLVPALYDDWAATERERYRLLYQKALRELSSGLEARREYTHAIEVVEKLVLADPLLESTYRQLMRLHALNNDRAAALQVYQQCATLLEQELGVEPSPKTVVLRDNLLQTDELEDIAKAPMQPSDPYGSSESVALVAGAGDVALDIVGKPLAQVAEPTQEVPLLRSVDCVSAYAIDEKKRNTFAGVTQLVGRHDEWATLQNAWRLTQEGHSHSVVLRGEAGIGKTRLAEELAAWARQQGGQVAVSHCYTAQKSIPYGPVVRWLRSPTFSSAIDSLDKEWLTEIARLLPELGGGLRQIEATSPITESWHRRYLFDSLIQTVSAVGEPLLLIIDDLQWSDVESLEWLNTLLRENQTVLSAGQAQAPVLLLATLRAEEVHDTPYLRSWTQDLNRNGLLTDIALGPLNDADTLQLASNLSDSALSMEDGLKLFGQTEGHPLYIVESVRAGLIVGAAAMQESPSSLLAKTTSTTVAAATMESVIKARLEQLSDSTQSLMNLASVIGREFSYELLVEASNVDEGDIVDGLDEALERGVVREQEADTYDFSHIMLREALYDGLSNARRRFYHKTLANILESSAIIELDGSAGQIAFHFEKSGNQDKAIHYYRHAATAAQNVYANEEALSHYQYLLSSELVNALSFETRCEILSLAGQLWYLTGQWRDAISHYNQLLELAEANEQHRFRALAYLGLAQVDRRQARYAEAVERLQQARYSFTACDELLGLADTLDAMGDIHWTMENTDLAQQAHEEQQRIGEQVKSALIQCRAQLALGRMLWQLGDGKKGVEVCKEAFLLAESHDILEMKAKLAHAVAGISSGIGDFTELWTWELKALEYAQALGNQEIINRSIKNLSIAYAEVGDFKAFQQCTLYSLAGSMKIRDLWAVALTLNNYGFGRILHGEFDSTEELFQRALSIADYLKIPQQRLSALDSLSLFYLETNQFGRLRDLANQNPDLIQEIGTANMYAMEYAVTYNVLEAREQLQAGARPEEALSILRHMLTEAQGQPGAEIETVANLHYRIWCLDSSQEIARDEAAKLYATLYEQRPRIQFRYRYQQLTGLSLPKPARLEMPAILTEQEYDQELLLVQLDEWLAELQEQNA